MPKPVREFLRLVHVENIDLSRVRREDFEIIEYLKGIAPELIERVVLHEDKVPLFDKAEVETEIRDLFKRRCDLPSGGYLIIEPTEALVSVDVNSGRYTGKKDPEKTSLRTNIEAAREVARQLRLRDIGGIIVCDFIDMEEKKNRQKVFQAVEQELRKDRSPSKALQVSDFGLVIITRKRVKQSLERVMTEPCPYCSGSGAIKASATICYDILTEVKKVSAELDGYSLVLRVNPEIARAFKDDERELFRELEQAVGRPVTVRPDEQLHHEQFDLMAI